MRWERSEGAGSSVVRLPDQPDAWEESRGRAETGRQAVRDIAAGGAGRLAESKSQQGRTRGRRAVDRGLRGRSEWESLYELKPDVIGQQLLAPGQSGRKT